MTGQPQPPWTPNLSARAHARAYLFIVRTLASRGFLLSQITAWDEGPSFEVDLTVWYVCVQLNTLHTVSVDEKFLTTFNREKELSCLPALTIAGVATPPLGTYGAPTTGAEATTGDLGVFPDPDERDLGQVIHW